MTITSRELRNHLPIFATVMFADDLYYKPTLAWLQGPFWKWFSSWRAEMNLNNWTRSNDCDNFARAYCQAAEDCHSLTTKDGALAVGEFWYHRHTDGAHAIVCALTDQGFIYIEPQNNHRLMLLPKEIESCFFARF